MDNEMNDSIERSLEDLDTTTAERQTLIERGPERDCIVIVLENELEFKFLKKLCTGEVNENLAIDVWIQVEQALRPLGRMDFTFKNIQKIHSYNSKLKIGLYDIKKNKIFKLTTKEEIILP